MKFKKLGMLALSATFLFALASCDTGSKKQTPTKAVTTTQKVTPTTNNPVTKSNDTQVDNKYKIFLLAQSSGFNGTYEEWLASIKGDSISLKVVDGKLKWKYSSENDSEYRELLDLTSLKGADGKTPVITIGNNGNWFIDGEDTLVKARATDGNGIASIALKNKVGKVDTYTITFTDGTTTEFTVTNGQDGEGKAIESIAKTATNGLVDTYTITFSDADTYTFDVTNGAAGAAGKGISSIAFKESSGKVDTYTITFTDNTTFDFTVTNGKDAEEPDPNVFEFYDMVDSDTLIKHTVTINGTQSETILSSFKGEWVEFFKTIIDYDSNHRVTLEEADRWSDENNKWVGEKKIEYEYTDDGMYIIQYEWNDSSDSWVMPSSKIKETYGNNGLESRIEIPWDDNTNDWSTTIMNASEYHNGQKISEVTYKWSSTKNDWSEYGNATYYSNSTASNTTVYANYTWENETSGWTDATFEARGIISRGGNKYYDVQLFYSWDKTNNKYVTTRVVETDCRNTSNSTEYDSSNLPSWKDNYLWFKKVETMHTYNTISYSPEIVKVHETYFDYYYSPVVMSFIPETFVDKEYIYYPLNFEVIGGKRDSDEIVLSETKALGEYFIDEDMFSLGYSTTATKDSNDRVTQLVTKKYENSKETTYKVVDITYNENGRLVSKNDKTYSDNGTLTETWITTYTYDENNKWISTLLIKKVEETDDDFVNYWKCEVTYVTDNYSVQGYLYENGEWVTDTNW